MFLTVNKLWWALIFAVTHQGIHCLNVSFEWFAIVRYAIARYFIPIAFGYVIFPLVNLFLAQIDFQLLFATDKWKASYVGFINLSNGARVSSCSNEKFSIFIAIRCKCLYYHAISTVHSVYSIVFRIFRTFRSIYCICGSVFFASGSIFSSSAIAVLVFLLLFSVFSRRMNRN